jgi:hypothetical protein
LTDGLIADLQALRNAGPAQNVSLSSEDRERVKRILDKYPALLHAAAESALVISQRLAQGLRIGDASTLFYEVTPRLVIASLDLTTGLALDLRRNTVRALARKSSGSELVRANLARSVADAAIEGTLLMPKAQPRRIAAIDIFDRARTEGIRLVAVRGGATLAALQASDLARARMANVEPGNLLIAPERTPSAISSHFAWWQLDPSTGEAISVLDTGLNGAQDLAEYAETNEISALAYEVPPPGPAKFAAQWLLHRPFEVISPMAADVAAPWAQCYIFDAYMAQELLEALWFAGCSFGICA